MGGGGGVLDLIYCTGSRIINIGCCILCICLHKTIRIVLNTCIILVSLSFFHNSMHKERRSLGRSAYILVITTYLWEYSDFSTGILEVSEQYIFLVSWMISNCLLKWTINPQNTIACTCCALFLHVIGLLFEQCSTFFFYDGVKHSVTSFLIDRMLE